MRFRYLEAVAWILGALFLIGFMSYIISSELEEDKRRSVACAELGGYIEDNTSLCRDRKTDAVLATWSELEGK